METKKKIIITLAMILSIYIIAIITGVMFIVFLIQGNFIRAGIVLIIELLLFYIGRELRREVWIRK
jgi:nicotinamide riboside transporter PnuC